MVIIPPKLADYQKKIVLSKARFTITEASTKSGKTYSHIIWLYGKAHEEGVDHEGKNYWWVAPVSYQAQIAYDRYKRYLRATGLYRFNDTSQIIFCPNGARIWFKSAEKPDNLFGEDVYAAVFDEAPRAREAAWFALRTTLTSTGGQCKMIGNFGGIGNWVHRLKDKAKSDPQYQYFKITCYDAIREGILEKSEVDQARKDLPEKIFRELYEVEPTEGTGQLINYESIQKLFSNTHIESGENYITADIARMGKDLTIIRVWDGLRNFKTVRLDKNTIPECVEAIKKEMVEFNVNLNRTIVDEDGIGGGVKDYLNCIGFVNGSVAIKVDGEKQNFANLKAQCYWKLAKMINQNKIYVKPIHNEEQMLTEELEWVRLPKEIDTMRIAMMSKDIVKKELGRSPDFADSLMMRMYWEVDPSYGEYNIW